MAKSMLVTTRPSSNLFSIHDISAPFCAVHQLLHPPAPRSSSRPENIPVGPNPGGADIPVRHEPHPSFRRADILVRHAYPPVAPPTIPKYSFSLSLTNPPIPLRNLTKIAIQPRNKPPIYGGAVFYEQRPYIPTFPRAPSSGASLSLRPSLPHTNAPKCPTMSRAPKNVLQLDPNTVNSSPSS
jgi:hypothetical protein